MQIIDIYLMFKTADTANISVESLLKQLLLCSLPPHFRALWATVSTSEINAFFFFFLLLLIAQGRKEPSVVNLYTPCCMSLHTERMITSPDLVILRAGGPGEVGVC